MQAISHALTVDSLLVMAPILRHRSFISAVGPYRSLASQPVDDEAVAAHTSTHCAAMAIWQRCSLSMPVLQWLQSSVDANAVPEALPPRPDELLDATIASLNTPALSASTWLACIAESEEMASRSALIRLPTAVMRMAHASVRVQLCEVQVGAAEPPPRECVFGGVFADDVSPRIAMWSTLVGVLETCRGPYSPARSALATVAGIVNRQCSLLLKVLFASDAEFDSSQTHDDSAANETIAHALVSLLNHASRSMRECYLSGAGACS